MNENWKNDERKEEQIYTGSGYKIAWKTVIYTSNHNVTESFTSIVLIESESFSMESHKENER